MAPTEPPSPIALRVKVPPGHLSGTSNDEFTLGTLPTTASILQVRTRIQGLLPSHPAPERQRLLYAGRALVDNDQSLADALNTRRDASQVEYVIHLLVKGEQGTGNAAAHGQAHSSTVSTPLGGTPRAGTPQAQPPGPAVPLPPLAGAAPPQGLPPLPQGHHMPANLTPQQAQHMALLQQRQAAQIQMRQAQLQQMQRQQFAPPFGPAAVGLGMGMPGMMPNQGGNGGIGQSGQQGVGAGTTATGEQQAPVPQTGSTPATGTTEGGGAHAHNNAADTPSHQSDATPQAQQPPPQGAPHRPISGQGFHLQGVGPDGNRFEIHQQTLNIPGMPMLGAGLPPVFPFGMPGMPPPQQAPQAGGVGSALNRARQNVAEMRQMVEEMRRENATEEERQRAQRLEERIQAVNEYIDPFGVGQTSRSATPLRAQPPNAPQQAMPGQPLPIPGMGTTRPITLTSRNPTMPLMNPGSDTTCFLLSGRNGPQALLFSPEHGEFAGSLSGRPNPSYRYVPNSQLRATAAPPPTPTATTNVQDQQPQAQPPAPVADQAPPAVAAAPAPPAAAQDPVQALMGHFWLLFRIMIFAYFVLGTNMGWRRPMALALIGAGFWMIRAGLFGDGGVLRRWWDGIVRVDRGPVRQQAQQGGEGDGQQQGGQVNRARDPTPEQAAQRLLHQREEALQRAPLHRLREQIGPVERAAALFLASLWPGVGEAHVRAREEAERRAQEEEVARRRADEETREKEDAERKAREEGEGENDKVESEKRGQADGVGGKAEVGGEQISSSSAVGGETASVDNVARS